MESRVIAVYERPDTFRGYSRINHYHVPVRFDCTVTDNSSFREMGVLVNGKAVPDYFDISALNYKGERIWNYHFEDRASANNYFAGLLSRYKDLRRVQ